MPSLWNRNKKKVSGIELCPGISIDESFYEMKEKRLKTLFMKGVIVYLLSMGSVGCYLSAMDCEFSAITLNIILFFSAIGCAYLYYNRIVENVGYLFLFAVFFGAAILFRDYINSGFYAVVNDTLEEAAIYLDMEGMQQYNERISNRYLAVTIAMCFIGIVTNILLNVYISRRMQYIVAIVVVMTVNLVPLYFEHEPDTIYSLMLLTGITLTYIMKSGQHYKVHTTDQAFEADKKNNLKYVYNIKSVRQTLLLGVIYVILCVSVMSLAFPKDTYDSSFPNNKYKMATMETAANLFALGLAGLFNFYPNTGGLNGGTLGGVSSIHLDYNTDLTLHVTPYSYEPIYLKSFTGAVYLPYTNKWVSLSEEDEKNNAYEEDFLEDAYEKHEKYTAKGYMEVLNVEAPNAIYLPYYSPDHIKTVYYGSRATYEYYPRFAANTEEVPAHDIPEQYLDIPEENLSVIRNFCREAGFSGTDDEIIEQVAAYYQENIPYTIRPGATPRREDFINYFLSKNKKGYCAHFASAATLIFRYMGIPARYVEGYAVSYNQIVDGELLDEDYGDYYDGYSELGKTGLVEVNITDADAHAWVEVYDDRYGWVVVDPTPAAGEEDTVDFWSAFQDFFDDGDTDNAESVVQGGNGIQISDDVMHMAAIVVISVFLIALLVLGIWVLIPRFRYAIAYQRAGRNDRLVMQYNRYLRKVRKSEKPLQDKMNYREQIEYLTEHELLSMTEEEKERFTDTLQEAGFSNREVAEADYAQAVEYLKQKEAKDRQKTRNKRKD